jgi:hypothetical protein
MQQVQLFRRATSVISPREQILLINKARQDRVCVAYNSAHVARRPCPPSTSSPVLDSVTDTATLSVPKAPPAPRGRSIRFSEAYPAIGHAAAAWPASFGESEPCQHERLRIRAVVGYLMMMSPGRHLNIICRVRPPIVFAPFNLR